MKFISRGQNVWKFTRPVFHVYTSPFQGLAINGRIERESLKK